MSGINHRMVFLKRAVVLFGSLGFLSSSSTGCSGQARELNRGSSLGAPVIGDGGTRSDGTDFGQIYTVTKIVEAESDIAEWTNADLPFTGPRRQLGQSATDSQWPFKFTYSYPPNNYKLNEAHVVLITSRDSSDTEGIFVDGVMTGRPPNNMISGTSTRITNRHYTCTGCSGATIPATPSNTYFMDWALNHYKISTANSFDLNVADLLAPTALKAADVVGDGVLRVVTGDDAMVQTDGPLTSRPLLFLEGFTVSRSALSCVTSPAYKFLNTYIHVDGNSIGSASFSGTALTPSASWGSANSSFRSVEFHYDPRLPKIADLSRLSLTRAELRMQVKRAAGAAAIVVNGVGLSDDAFDRGRATADVEEWDDSAGANAVWDAFVASVPATGVATNAALDLISLLGASRVRDLLAQGKLNVAVAGSLASVYGQGATTGRTYGVSVNGPELVLEGTYDTLLCEVPNDPASPLSDSSGDPGSCDFDQASPVASSVQVVNVTSSSATIQWLTNEPADSQVAYGVGGTTLTTTPDPAPTAFHAVPLTGLDPYKYYQFAIRTKDGCGNQTISATRTFRTLR